MKPLQPDTLVRNPDGLPIVASVVVGCPASRLWNVVGNFSGFDVFIPDLTHIEMTGTGVGALRTKFFRDGNCVVEQLNSRDEQAMHMTWTTIYNTPGRGQVMGGDPRGSTRRGVFQGDMDDYCRAHG